MNSTTYLNLSMATWLVIGMFLMHFIASTLNHQNWQSGWLTSITLLVMVALKTPEAELLLYVAIQLWFIRHNQQTFQWSIAQSLLLLLVVYYFPALLGMTLLSLVVISLALKSWQWLNQTVELMALGQIILLLLLGLLLLADASQWFVLLVSIVLLIFMFVDTEPANNTVADDQWLGAVEMARHSERQRIYRNIHDEVGASLLELIYQLEGQKAQKTAKSLMSKVRQSVAETSQYRMLIEDLIQDISVEAKMRLNTAGIEFSSKLAIDNNEYITKFTPVRLLRLIREVVSNIIKHSKCTHVVFTVVWNQSQKYITITDDGIGIKSKKNQGKGLKSIQQRAEKIAARVFWKGQQSEGLEVRIEFVQDD